MITVGEGAVNVQVISREVYTPGEETEKETELFIRDGDENIIISRHESI